MEIDTAADISLTHLEARQGVVMGAHPQTSEPHRSQRTYQAAVQDTVPASSHLALPVKVPHVVAFRKAFKSKVITHNRMEDTEGYVLNCEWWEGRVYSG
jgi:hypothetical protein